MNMKKKHFLTVFFSFCPNDLSIALNHGTQHHYIKIYEIRGQKVMLDFDLAELYGIPTKALKQAINRNIKRFPEDFMFITNDLEFQHLRSQIVTSSGEA